jgi:hypothetical protein
MHFKNISNDHHSNFLQIVGGQSVNGILALPPGDSNAQLQGNFSVK